MNAPTGAPPRNRSPLPVLETEPVRRGPDRATDRRLAFAGLAVAALFLAAAAGSLALPPGIRLGWWLPLHLVLAGAAGTAIAAMLPFFVAALAVAPPVPGWLHGGAIGLVASGALLAGLGRAADPGVGAVIPTVGAALFVAGAAAVAASALLPLRQAAGQRRPATEAAYVAALICVMAGVTLGGSYLAGLPAIVDAWSRLRVAHAWLNVFGFLTLVIAGTLLHFAPTVAGARIRARASGRVAVATLGAGVVVGVAGYVLAVDAFAVAGATLLVAGAAALTWHGIAVQRDAVGWSTDRSWHRLTSWSLLAAPAWLLVTTAIVAGRVFAAGASGAGWRLESILGPLIAGFAIQVLVGAIAHLVPAIGPGDPRGRAAARRTLGAFGSARVVGWNLATAALSVGLVGGLPALAVTGIALLGLLAAATLLSFLTVFASSFASGRAGVGA